MTLDLRSALDIELPTVERELIEVTRMLNPDPNWEHRDEAGHVHRWVGEKLPSLELIADSYAMEEWDDEPWVSSSHYECVECRAHVEPGFVFGRKFLCSWIEQTVYIHRDDG